MLKKYEKFLKELDKKLKKYFDEQSEYICCKEGCSGCCEVGDYPFTQLEMMYLMEGFKALPNDIKILVKNSLMQTKNNKCSVYKYRGITCRTFGLAYFTKDKIVKVPECVHQNLCYSKVFKDNELLTEPVKECLGLFDIVDSKLAKKYKLEFGPSRSLIDWFQ